MSFQIFLSVRHYFYKLDWTIFLLSDNTMKKITQDVLVRCLIIVSDHNAKIGWTFLKFGQTMSGE